MSGRVATMPFRAPGQLGRESPLPLEVTRVLDEVPAHLVPDQLVAEARRVAGVAAALYVVDIDGSHLLRLAGSEEFPDRLEDPPALGPEIVPEGLPEFYERLEQQLPGCVPEPLWLRGRVTGLLLCVGTPVGLPRRHRQAGRCGPRPRHRLHRLHRGCAAPQTHHAGRRGPAATYSFRIVRIAGAQLAGVPPPELRRRRRLVRLRREPRRGLAGGRGRGQATDPTAAGPRGRRARERSRAARRSRIRSSSPALARVHETVRQLEQPRTST